jgi:hypothetical protein
MTLTQLFFCKGLNPPDKCKKLIQQIDPLNCAIHLFASCWNARPQQEFYAYLKSASSDIGAAGRDSVKRTLSLQ